MTCGRPPTDARIIGNTTMKPSTSTTSCTALTQTEVSSPPAVKYTVTTMPPMTEPTQRSSPVTALRTNPIAISCAARIPRLPTQRSDAIMARTSRP